MTTIRLSKAQCAALARLIRFELAAYAEAECPPDDAPTFDRNAEIFTGSDLDAVAPLAAVLEAGAKAKRT